MTWGNHGTYLIYFDDLRDVKEGNDGKIRYIIAIEFNHTTNQEDVNKILSADPELKFAKTPASECARASYPWHSFISYSIAPNYVYPAMEEYY